ncbi:MAG: hypothetical protein EZS28_020680 [Streblomastix strix]|uniref:NrS-1 polymerase-like helicase domain-containing protein n=1 Tax=Streblomastix strix TaxID=222440 RepID=A0A5J4VMU7_9EUKA|nr:MAG: hypothetical protein EZS28_020680 [Streblomastix strix]
MITAGLNAARQQIQAKTIKQRIEGAIINLYDYRKYADEKSKNKLLTGRTLDLSLCKDDDLCVIDFDIDHGSKLNDKEKERIRQNIITNMLPSNVGLIQRARGGIHAYCNRNGYKLPSNRNEKVVKYGDNLEIDIFAQMYTQKDGRSIENRVVLPNSKIRIVEKEEQKKEILYYRELNDWANATHLASLYDILGKWNLDLTSKDLSSKDFSIINDDCTIEPMSKQIADSCVQGLKQLTIHNDTNILEREITLLPLFMGLNGLQQVSAQYKEEAYSQVYSNNTLTAKAQDNWSDRKRRYTDKANPWILTKIIKLHNNKYYESTLKPLIIQEQEAKRQLKIEAAVSLIERNEINLLDPFTLKDLSQKALTGKYHNKLELVAQDLLKVMRIVPCPNGWCFIIKEYNCLIEKNVVNYKGKSAIYDQLHSIRLWDDGKKHITAVDALEQYHSLFEKLGIKFLSSNPDIFSVFQGFKYVKLDEVNYSKIDQFLGLVKDTISANNEIVYQYILNWFAYIIQNVGKKTETAIILQGLQGVGKNIFTNVLCELLAGYSSKNITDIDDFVGKLNTAIENKMLAIANEMKNFGEQRMSNMDALKSIITEISFMINEKSIPKHEVENVVNIIIATNNVYPLKIENSDRRYVVCKCGSVHRGDLTYFTNLCASFDDEFYKNLFTFFLERDISQFNPRDIPMTQAKREIIRASRSKVDDVILNNFNQFKDGVRIESVEQWKPTDMILKNYQIAINSVCHKVRKVINGQRKRVYQLNEEMVSIYQNMLDEDAIESDYETDTE